MSKPSRYGSRVGEHQVLASAESVGVAVVELFDAVDVLPKGLAATRS
jgi:hypothetical protein